jgi:hypothetical protein
MQQQQQQQQQRQKERWQSVETRYQPGIRLQRSVKDRHFCQFDISYLCQNLIMLVLAVLFRNTFQPIFDLNVPIEDVSGIGVDKSRIFACYLRVNTKIKTKPNILHYVSFLGFALVYST